VAVKNTAVYRAAPCKATKPLVAKTLEPHMKSIAAKFLALTALCTQLTGCFLDCPDGTSLRCREHKTVTECRPTYNGGTRCESRQECASYACVQNGRPGRYPHASLAEMSESPKLRLSELKNDDVMPMIANGDIEKAAQYGLDTGDVMSLLVKGNIGSDRTERLARINGASTEAIAAKIKEIHTRFESERKDISSAYWQTCMANGAWKTDRNQSCEKAFWPGCSPLDRASYCVSGIGAKRLQL
jgi:hypothetical protein